MLTGDDFASVKDHEYCDDSKNIFISDSFLKAASLH